MKKVKKSKVAATETAVAEPKAKSKKSAKGLPCLCGCGQPTITDAARFIPGHDAKLKGLLIKVERGELKKSAVPDVAKPFLQKSAMSGAYSLPTESGNTPDEDKFGVPFAERKEQFEADKAAKAADKKAKLKKLQKKAAKKAKAAAAAAEADEDYDDEDEVEE